MAPNSLHSISPRTTITTTLTAFPGQPPFTLLYPWPPHITLIASPPIFTDIVAIVVNTAGSPVNTATLTQAAYSVSTPTSTSPPRDRGPAIPLVLERFCEKWECWSKGQQVGTAIAAVVIGILIIWVMYWGLCPAHGKRGGVRAVWL